MLHKVRFDNYGSGPLTASCLDRQRPLNYGKGTVQGIVYRISDNTCTRITTTHALIMIGTQITSIVWNVRLLLKFYSIVRTSFLSFGCLVSSSRSDKNADQIFKWQLEKTFRLSFVSSAKQLGVLTKVVSFHWILYDWISVSWEH